VHSSTSSCATGSPNRYNVDAFAEGRNEQRAEVSNPGSDGRSRWRSS
jgi:hypothetical protein